MNSKFYTNHFFESIHSSSTLAAKLIVPIIYNSLRPKSVVDIGCGSGAWLAAWKTQPFAPKVLGVDSQLNQTLASILKSGEFLENNLEDSLNIDETFDLTICLEVAEHIRPEFSESLVNSLTKLSKFILFSAAPPGDGGMNHVNEKPFGFWKELFESHGYRCFDYIRPKIQSEKKIAPWYRYNVFLYIHESKIQNIPQDLLMTQLGVDQQPTDVSPFSWRLRKLLLSQFSVNFVTKLSIAKHWILLNLKR